MALEDEIRKYVLITGQVHNSPYTGKTLMTPTIDEICAIYSVSAEVVANVLLSLSIASGITHAKR